MRAIVIKEYGGPEQLSLENVPEPVDEPGCVIVRVRAFGLNHAEIYFRKGLWGEVAKVSGIECAGEVHSDPDGHFRPGQKVFALMGGMGRNINGSYAEFTQVPAANVVAVESSLSWPELAALPESYATAWTCLYRNLELQRGQTLLIRGATSALGQAALNIAAVAGARVVATSRNPERFQGLRGLGAESVLQEGPDLAARVRSSFPDGIDTVLELIGTSTLLDSLRCVRAGGRVCMAGFLGGGDPIASFDPLQNMPSGVHLSFFASAFTFGNRSYPLSAIPFQTFVQNAADRVYKAAPARIFPFEQIQEAHRCMESNQANGKIVVVL